MKLVPKKPKAIPEDDPSDWDLEETLVVKAQPPPPPAVYPESTLPVYGSGYYVEKYRKEKWKLLQRCSSMQEARQVFEDYHREKGKRCRILKVEGNVWHITDSAYLLAPAKKIDTFKVKKKAEKENESFFVFKRRFKHRAQMKISELKDEEHYIVTIRTGYGCAMRIIPGYRLKKEKFYRKRLSKNWLGLKPGHWTRKMQPEYLGNYPKQVEVILPPDEKGQVFSSDVTPFSATNYEEREKKDREFAKLVNKFLIR